MKHSFRCAWFLVMLLLPLMHACGMSAPVHFYALSGDVPEAEVAPSGGPCFSLAVGPITIPAYLDRSGLVTQQGANELAVADFDQWGESLNDGLTRVLMEDLSDSMCIEPIAPVPLPEGIRTDYQVAVQIRRFDGILGKQAWLRGSWTVLDAEGNLVSWKRSNLQKTVHGEDFPSLVAAMSSLALDLSHEIAAELQEIVAKKATKQAGDASEE